MLAAKRRSTLGSNNPSDYIHTFIIVIERLIDIAHTTLAFFGIVRRFWTTFWAVNDLQAGHCGLWVSRRQSTLQPRRYQGKCFHSVVLYTKLV